MRIYFKVNQRHSATPFVLDDEFSSGLEGARSADSRVIDDCPAHRELSLQLHAAILGHPESKDGSKGNSGIGVRAAPFADITVGVKIPGILREQFPTFVAFIQRYTPNDLDIPAFVITVVMTWPKTRCVRWR